MIIAAETAARRRKLALLLAVTGLLAVMTALLPRIELPPSYHNFADQRSLLGVPRFADVVSNAPFLIIGLLGLRFVSSGHRKGKFMDARETWPWMVFFLGVAATAFGSAYYHLHPNNARLVWDRLPITISFMGFLAAMLGERISPVLGIRCLFPLLTIGLASVIYWIWTAELGRGDLRPYGFVQFFPVLAVGLLVWLFPPRYSRTNDLFAVVAFYAAAKACEFLDVPIYSLTRIVSGHTLKHLFAAAASYWLLRMLRLRAPIEQHAR